MALPSARPQAGEGLTILAEAYDFKERLGRIVALDGCGGGGPAREVLRKGWHLSYPQLIEHGGAIYCLPEMGAAGIVQLFRADPFPERWQADRVLVRDVPAVDTTLWRGDDRWWMFAGRLDIERDANLYLFHAPDLFGPWTPHPLNPVVSDQRGGRMAGPIFAAAGKTYRAGQDCTRTYGGAVVVHEIVELTPERYRERVVARLDPDPAGPYPHGLHTLCPAGGWTLIDGKRFRRSWRPVAAQLQYRLRRKRPH